MSDEVWQAIDAQRAGLADLLERLTPQEWARASLCGEWTVRDVAGHLAWQGRIDYAATLLLFARHAGRMHPAIRDAARRRAQRPTAELVGAIRSLIGTRRPVPGMSELESLIDILVHSQDIAIPLDRPLDVAAGAAVIAAERIWTKPSLFPETRYLRSYHLAATDVAWAAGAGPEVSGPAAALLLLLSGRYAHLPRLTGPGARQIATTRG